MKLKKANILLVLLAFSPIFGAEDNDLKSNEEVSSKSSKAVQTCKEIMGVAAVVGFGVATTFASETIKECFQKPAYKYVQEAIKDYFKKYIYDYSKKSLTTTEKTLGGLTLASLYVLYKWYTTETGKEPKQKVEVDIRPKTFKAFMILLLDKDSGVGLIKRFNYELLTIKKDLETGNKQGLELLPLIYPELIAALDATQRQYLNDLIRQVTGSNILQ